MKYLKYLFIFIFIIVQSQTKWDLKQCLGYTLTHHPVIQQSLLQVNKAERQIYVAKGQLLPNLVGNIGNNYSFGSTINPATNQREALNTQNIPFNISSGIDLFNWKNYMNISLSKIQKETSSYTLQSVKNDISLQVIQLFFQYQYDNAWYHVLQTQIDGIEAQIKQTEKEVEIGTRSKSDIYDVKANLGTIQEQWISAKNAKELSKNSLLTVLTITKDSLDFVIKDDIVGNLSWQTDDFIQKTILKNPAYLASLSQNKWATKNVDAYKADYFPRLYGQYQWSTFYSKILNIPPSTTFNNQFSQNQSNQINLGLEIPVFNRFQTKNKIQIAKLDLKNANLEQEKITLTLTKELKAIQIQYKNALDKYDLLKNNFVNQENSFHKSEEKFKEGLIDAYTLFVVRNNWLQANYTLIKSKYDVLLQEELQKIYLKN